MAMKASGFRAVDRITAGADKELWQSYSHAGIKKDFWSLPQWLQVWGWRWTSQMPKSTMHYWTQEENYKQRGLRKQKVQSPRARHLEKENFALFYYKSEKVTVWFRCGNEKRERKFLPKELYLSQHASNTLHTDTVSWRDLKTTRGGRFSQSDWFRTLSLSIAPQTLHSL